MNQDTCFGVYPSCLDSPPHGASRCHCRYQSFEGAALSCKNELLRRTGCPVEQWVQVLLFVVEHQRQIPPVQQFASCCLLAGFLQRINISLNVNCQACLDELLGAALQVGTRVIAHGLQSPTGQHLNATAGVVSSGVKSSRVGVLFGD